MIERRRGKPGRRDYDNMTCPFHEGTCKDIEHLMAKSEEHADKKSITSLWSKLDTKLDKGIFIAYISSIVILISIACAAFGWVASEVVASKTQIAILIVNQSKLLKHFDIAPVKAADIKDN